MEVERRWIRIFSRCKLEKDDAKRPEKKMCSVERANRWSSDIRSTSSGLAEAGASPVTHRTQTRTKKS
jgi:hypothetical protein